MGSICFLRGSPSLLWGSQRIPLTPEHWCVAWNSSAHMLLLYPPTGICPIMKHRSPARSQHYPFPTSSVLGCPLSTIQSCWGRITVLCIQHCENRSYCCYFSPCWALNSLLAEIMLSHTHKLVLLTWGTSQTTDNKVGWEEVWMKSPVLSCRFLGMAWITLRKQELTWDEDLSTAPWFTEETLPYFSPVTWSCF